MTVTTQVPAGERAKVCAAIVARAYTVPEISSRSERTIARALRRGRMILALDGGELAAWAISESCGPGVQELGFFFVEPAYRDGDAMRRVTAAALALRRRSVVVTTAERYATYLVAEQGFARTTLWGATVATRGMFIARRLTWLRLREARRQVRSARPNYLVRERVSA